MSDTPSRFSTGYWSVAPGSWTVVPQGPESSCQLTLIPPGGAEGGALQFSSARKKASRITHGEIVEFAEKQLGAAGHALAVYGEFRGVMSQRPVSEMPLYWWLANGSLMLFVTYFRESLVPAAELQEVDAILSTLRCEDSDSWQRAS